MYEFSVLCLLVLQAIAFIRPIKIDHAGLGPEISVAKVLHHDEQTNDFRNDDSSKLKHDHRNMGAPHRAESRCRAVSVEASPPLRSSGSSDDYQHFNVVPVRMVQLPVGICGSARK
jgi:hypothetical protein